MQDPQYQHGACRHAIGDYIGQAGDDQFVGASNARCPPALRKRKQAQDLVADGIIDFDGYARAIKFDEVEDGFTILDSEGRPLQSHD